MGESLNPSALSRLIHERRPDWTRTLAARRAAAACLVVLAAVSALRDDPHGDQTDIVVAARDLSPGIELTAADVRLEKRLAATVPDGAAVTVDNVVGSTLAGPARRGEVLTDVRLLGPRLAQLAVGPDARIVPLHLADTGLLDIVRPGDVVDVLAAADDEVGPRVVATDAVVVLVSEKPKGPGGGERVLLVALPAHAANDVAGATLTQAVTLTFH
jgi:Flp pilus assembly protein CpaB